MLARLVKYGVRGILGEPHLELTALARIYQSIDHPWNVLVGMFGVVDLQAP
jgi:hypothetical protein